MAKAYIVSADLGTTYIKVGLYDGSLTCLAAESEKTRAEAPQAGAYSQDPDAFVHGTLRLIKKILEQSRILPGEVGAVSFTGQMAGTMAIDSEWNALTPWTGTLDIRHMPYGKVMLEKCGEEILRLSGTNAPFMAPKMKWVEKEYPAAYGKAAKFLNLSGYVAGKISDLPAGAGVHGHDVPHLDGYWGPRQGRLVGVPVPRLRHRHVSSSAGGRPGVAGRRPEQVGRLGMRPGAGDPRGLRRGGQVGRLPCRRAP